MASADSIMDVPLFVIENLGLWYGAHAAFSDVSVSLPQNRVSAIIGPSGCGKTSFLSCLNRLDELIEGTRRQGRILWQGQDIQAVDSVALRCQVGMIFQKPNPFPLSIRGNIELPLREHGLTHKKQRAERVEEVLRQAGLWDEVKDRLDQPALKLSGGQQQRLCIARALALRPRVLLMDEPCSALDPIASGVIEDLILELKKAYSVVIVTHNLPQARRIADFVAFFWHCDGAGRLIECGPAQTVFQNPRDPLTANYVQGRTG